MHRRIALLFLAAWLVCLAPARAADKPLNVIFFLVDDWGWTDAGCYGSDLYETPNIDRLASQSVRFTDGYAACTVCSPTRAAVMTGMYPGRTNVTDWIPGMFHSRNAQQRATYPLMPPDWTQKLEHRHTSIAEAMKAAGYRTLHVGKWHLTPSTNDLGILRQYYPDRQGFDINIAGNQWGAPGSYHFPFQRPARGRNAASRDDPVYTRTMNFPDSGQPGDYLTDVLTTEMLKQVEKWKDEPFFVYFPFYNVHTPIQGRKDLVEHYKTRVKNGLRHTNPEYAAMVGAVDENIGRVMAKLDQLGIADNTAIFLTGDNGGLDRNGNPTENIPLRAGKGSPYEGGVRVPTIVKWPGAAPAGAVCREPVITVDYYPTILEMTGAKGDAGHNANVDGVSLASLLKEPQTSLQRDAIYWHYPHYHSGGSEPYSAIRARDWRLVEFQLDGRVELFNLAKDLSETTDLAKSMPDKAAQLRDKLHAWRKSVGAQMAVANPEYKP